MALDIVSTLIGLAVTIIVMIIFVAPSLWIATKSVEIKRISYPIKGVKELFIVSFRVVCVGRCRLL